MIFKSRTGTGVTGTLRYIRGPGRDEDGKLKPDNDRATSLGGQNFGFDPDDDRKIDIARRMLEWMGSPDYQGDKKKQCQNDCLHVSLSWDRTHKPDRDEQREACREFLKALGMEKSRALFFSHNDKSYPHVHIVASRIDPETRMAYDDYQRMYKGMRRAIVWEREKNQITKNRQWQHDQAKAVEQNDHKKLLELLMKGEATVTKNRLDLALAFGGKLGNRLEATREAFVKHHDMLRLKKYQSGRTAAYTTKEIWKEEAQALALARQVKERSGFGIDQDTIKKYGDRFTLNDEQRQALWHLTRDNGMGMLSGQAGTGKTRVMQAVRQVYEDHGYQVRGLGYTNKVAQQLGRDGFRNSQTIDSELMRLKFADKDRSPWDDRTIIMPDEAAQIKTEHMLELLRHAQKHGSKMIPVGDPRQLGSVDRGGLYAVMEKRFGAARLQEVMRNHDPDQKRAWNKMHEAKWGKAVDAFKRADAFKWHDTKDQAIDALIRDYAKDYLENPTARRLMLAGTNDEVDRLNKFAQELRKQDGKLGSPMQMDTTKGPVQFAVGDRVVMNETPNKEDKRKGLVNGVFGTVTGLRESPDGRREMTMEIDRKEGEQKRAFRFNVGLDKDNREVSGVGLGYAGTVYKAQGSTYDRTYLLHNPQSTRPTNYVQLSRHADKAKLYISREDTAGYDHLTDQLKHGADKTSAHAYMMDEGDRAKMERDRNSDNGMERDAPQREQPAPEREQKDQKIFFDRKNIKESNSMPETEPEMPQKLKPWERFIDRWLGDDGPPSHPIQRDRVVEDRERGR